MLTSVAHLDKGSMFRSYFCLLWSREPDYLWIVGPATFKPRASTMEKNLRWSAQSLMFDLCSGAVDVVVFDRMVCRLEPILVREDEDWMKIVPKAENNRPFKGSDSILNLRYLSYPSSFRNDEILDKKLRTGFIILCCRVSSLSNISMLPIELKPSNRLPSFPDAEEFGDHSPPVMTHVAAYLSEAN